MPRRMNELLVAACYLAVLVLVAACFAYLWRTRGEAEPHDRPSERGPGSAAVRSRPSPTSLQAIETARQLAGPSRLGELGTVLERLAAAEAWGIVVELRFSSVADAVQMILRPSGVDLYSHHLGAYPDHRERFEAAAARTGLTPQPAPEGTGELVVAIDGPWTEVAATAVAIVGEVYGIGPDEPVRVAAFP